ncbi:unnamed protein product [Rotaria sordida]|uniref:ADP ribosyltransferase domain-containing protein n=1 Tax=Rotaria sordida TaxID=392033 RepID=A0A820AHZ3_9BILA|nr:unnamed protein product [Rotaria sordida]CAF4188705.1 unnamed protein product [Rotaria sordida]
MSYSPTLNDIERIKHFFFRQDFGKIPRVIPEWSSSSDTRVIHYFLDKHILYSKLKENITETTYNAYWNNENDSQISLRNTNRIQFQMLTHVLSQMKQTHESKIEMLEECRSRYDGQQTKNEVQLKNIDKFEREYTPDQAIHWYTSDCFLYRIVNYMCRTEDIDLLYSLRYYMIDLLQQLKQLHLTSPVVTPVIVYRGQLMNINELQKYHVDEYYCTNTFMSTTQSQDVALMFAGDENSDKERVLFCIKIDTHENMVPFAMIKDFTTFSSEDEILLSIGFTFRICSVQKSSTDNIWIIEMVAVADTSGMTVEMKNKIDQFHINIQSTPALLMLGDLLLEMNEDQKAERYYRMFVDTESKDVMQLVTAYQGIGCACLRQCQYATALENYELALKISCQNLDNNINLSSIITIYKNIAQVHLSMTNYKSALNYYEACLIFMKQSPHIPNKHHSWNNFPLSVTKAIIGDLTLELYFKHCKRNCIPTLICITIYIFTPETWSKIIGIGLTLYQHIFFSYGNYYVFAFFIGIPLFGSNRNLLGLFYNITIQAYLAMVRDKKPNPPL